MPTSKQRLFLMAVFLIPNSQAVISNSMNTTMDSAGYYCSTNREVQYIHILYGDSPTGLPCSVTLQGNQALITQLLQAKRNTSICEQKAKDMALRLRDRKWHCQSSGL